MWVPAVRVLLSARVRDGVVQAVHIGVCVGGSKCYKVHRHSLPQSANTHLGGCVTAATTVVAVTAVSGGSTAAAAAAISEESSRFCLLVRNAFHTWLFNGPIGVHVEQQRLMGTTTTGSAPLHSCGCLPSMNIGLSVVPQRERNTR